MKARIDSSAYAGLDQVFGAIADWVSNYRKACAARSELANCGADEVARIASDLGLKSGELATLASKGPHSADLLLKMLDALGVDPKKLANAEPAVMHDLQRVCVSCARRQECMHEFDCETAGANFRKFCPNAYTLDALFGERVTGKYRKKNKLN